MAAASLSEKPNFYTYIHIRADDGKVFYVGKGKKSRSSTSHGRNLHWHRIVKKHGLKVEIIAAWRIESDAFEHERFLISCFRAMGQPLCNLTDGGEGMSGHVPSEETRRKMSLQRIGKVASAETRSKLSIASKSRIRTDEWKAKSSISNLGKKRSPETRSRISAAKIGVPQSLDVRQRQSERMKGSKSPMCGRTHTEEWLKKHSESMCGNKYRLGTTQSPEARRKVADKLTGKPKSPEHIENLKKAWIVRRAKLNDENLQNKLNQIM